jgi:antitoxin component of MazEF toxin-antitoxin module
MPRAFVTKIHQSRESSPSLRTTIPEAVATVLNIQRGDSLVWTVEAEARRVTVAKRTVSTGPFNR